MASYSPDEVNIAHNEGKVDPHAWIKVKVDIREKDGSLKRVLLDTTVGRVNFNQFVPKENGFVNALLT
jgi:DNA-directed RNA polymerase subunit beta'